MVAEAMVMPYFDYCSQVWSNCNCELSNKMQMLQNRLARILLSADIRAHVDDMMDSLNWIKLRDKWTNQMLIITFKCLSDNAPNYLCSMFNFTHSLHNYPTRTQTSNTLVVPHHTSNSGIRTFLCRASHLWNNLHESIHIDLDILTHYV